MSSSRSSPRTTPDAIRDELGMSLGGDEAGELTDSFLSRYARRAHQKVERTVVTDESIDPSDPMDRDLLADLEDLMGAAAAFKHVTGAASGREIQEVTQESATIRFASTSSSSSGSTAASTNPHLRDAYELDPTGRLRSDIERPSVYSRDGSERRW